MMLTSRRFGTLDDGIAVLHMECALADRSGRGNLASRPQRAGPV